MAQWEEPGNEFLIFLFSSFVNSAASKIQQYLGPRRAQGVLMLPPAGQCQVQSRDDSEGRSEEKATHVLLRPNQICPPAFQTLSLTLCLPLTMVPPLSPLSSFSNTLNAFLPRGLCTYSFVSPGGSSSSSSHGIERDCLTQPPMYPYPTSPPLLSQCPASSASRHTSLFDICCFTSLSSRSISSKRS